MIYQMGGIRGGRWFRTGFYTPVEHALRGFMDKMDGKEFEHALENRRAAREMARDAAMRGDPICGGYFALISSHWMAQQIDEFMDFDDSLPDEDDIRPEY